MPLADLRTFLQQLDALGDLKTVQGADRDREIGVITELSLQHDGPALLFGLTLFGAQQQRQGPSHRSDPSTAAGPSTASRTSRP